MMFLAEECCKGLDDIAASIKSDADRPKVGGEVKPGATCATYGRSETVAVEKGKLS